MCFWCVGIIRLRQGWTGELRSAALYLLKAWINGTKGKNANECVQSTDNTDKGGVVMIDLGVIMMTLVVMNAIKTVTVVSMSTIFV